MERFARHAREVKGLWPLEEMMSFARTGFFVTVMLSTLGAGGNELHAQGAPPQFRLMEATIPDVHRGIREGQITCRGLVQAYINRAKAYNGTCNRLVTEEMASTFLPNFSEYQTAMKSTAERPDGDPGKTPPVEFGRMEPTASDPDRSAAIRDDRRDSQCRASARVGDAQHPWRAIRHMQGRLR
jgi:hypothetical protein